MDDILTGGETVEEPFELYVQSKQIFREGGFNLRKFLTNSKHLQEQIDLKETQCTSSLSRDEPTYLAATLGTSHPSRREEHRVFGVLWNPASDQFLFNTSVTLSLLMTSVQLREISLASLASFMTCWGFSHPSSYASRSSFRSCVNVSATGMWLFQKSWKANGSS